MRAALITNFEVHNMVLLIQVLLYGILSYLGQWLSRKFVPLYTPTSKYESAHLVTSSVTLSIIIRKKIFA